MAVIELKDKGVHQFKFKYNGVFHHVQLEDRKGLCCFIKGWMENNQLTNKSYDLVGLAGEQAVSDDDLFDGPPRELGLFDGGLPF